MLKRRNRRLRVASLLGVASLLVLLLGGCGGPANKSAPVVADLPIIYMYDGRQDAGVVAVSGRDGSMLWHATLAFRSGITIIAGDVLYACMYPAVGSFGQDIVALRMHDGKQLWRTSLIPRTLNAGYCQMSADATTLAVNGGERDSYGLDPTLYALNTSDGTIRWHQTLGTYGVPVMQGETVYSIIPGDPKNYVPALGAFRASDGKELWQVLYHGGNYVANNAALYINDSTPDSGPKLSALDPRDGHHLWDRAHSGELLATTDRMVYLQGGDGAGLSALDAADGHLLWQWLPKPPSGVDGASVTQSFVYTAGDRDMFAVRTADGAQAWHTHLDQEDLSVRTNVTASGGVVFVMLEPAPCSLLCVSKNPRIVALDGATGAIYWRQDAPGAENFAEPAYS